MKEEKGFYEKIGKRLLDILLSGTALILLSPILIAISLMIKIDSRGPVFFKQERIGKNGVVFEIIKFRTMIENAEKIGDGLSIKNERDSRITQVGNILRKTSLDELPQLINVFIGSMSLIGPRPPVTYHPYKGFENYPAHFKPRFNVKPGISGYSQVKVRNSVSWDERIKLDLVYIKNITFTNDMKIIFQTFLRVLNSSNIYR
ncbi:sugar transferase [Streptococcus sp. ZJ151]|uniref:sugar transferase n=1 Tax=Streptococcus jiangjianxini TaxID=3161189 RepID=UPI0032EB9DDC